MKWGLALASIIVIIDQTSKAGIMTLLHARGPIIELTSFVNLVPVWNRGISFGLLNSSVPVWILSVVTAIITMMLIIWLISVQHHRLSALALGALIGGALGNLLDRLRFGAVFDFLDFHLAGWHWPAFNFADSAIVLGAIALAMISMRSTNTRDQQDSTDKLKI